MVASPDPPVVLEQGLNKVSVIRINRPPGNLLSTEVLGDITAVANDLQANPPGAVILWGGPETFSRGGDASEFTELNALVGHKITEAFHQATSAIAAIPCPTFAAIAGLATGGGLELTLACDFRFATADAHFGQVEVNLGLFPGGGGTQRLPRLIGPSRAKRLIFSGELIDADEAYRIGLIDGIIEINELLHNVRTRAEILSAKSGQAVRDAKRAIDIGIDLPLRDGLAEERRLFTNAAARIGAPEGGTTRGTVDRSKVMPVVPKDGADATLTATDHDSAQTTRR